MSWTDGSFSISGPAPAAKAEPRYATHPAWQQRFFEAGAPTTRLNEAHWLRADDQPINVWLASHLTTIRSRAIYECKQNGITQGIVNTFTDDVVGPDGPVLQVESDDSDYNEALEDTWRTWFAAPIPRPTVSGVTLLKMWIRNLWKCGEFLARMVTDSDADSQVQMRLMPIHPRRLGTPATLAGDPNTVMGIRFDSLARPATYYIGDSPVSGQYQLVTDISPYPPDLIVHEFIADEEDQARGIPWMNTGLQVAADLRDYDDQVQDAARQMADQAALLYTDHPDAEVWTNPEITTVERRTIKMVPPGWKPFAYSASQPPVQYPDYRAERMRELGRPRSMPLMMVRLDASNHNYSSARIDLQSYDRGIASIQYWLSGSDRSIGTLNRLVDEVAREARFTVRELRRRPAKVIYLWTWPRRPHVDPQKEAQGQRIGLETGTDTLTDALAANSRTLEQHVRTSRREREVLLAAGLPLPAWMTGQQRSATANSSSGSTAEVIDSEGETANVPTA